MARNLAEQYMEEGEKRAKRAAEAVARNLAEQYMEEGEKRARKAAEAMARNLAEQYMEEGEKRGLEKGIIRAKQDDLLGLIGEKFGPVPERVVRRVRALEDTETLDQLLKRLVHVNSIEEMQL